MEDSNQTSISDSKQGTLAILAGGGALPVLLIKKCQQLNRPYFVIGFHDQTDPSIAHMMTHFGAAGKIISAMKEKNVTEIVMAGHMKRPSLSQIKPDFKGAKIMARLTLKKSMGDNNLLSFLSVEMEKEGFKVVGVQNFIDQVLMPKGLLGNTQPDTQDKGDIARGIEVATTLGLADVGQSVVVEQGVVLAVEAIEGTDALLQRCKNLKRISDRPVGVLVKMKKPQQDRRFDLPTIGKITVDNAAAIGLKGIAVRAGETILLDADDIGAYADAKGIFIIGIDA